MSDYAARYRKIAGRFTETVRAVPDGAWEHPAPPEGWVARDVVGHLVGWLPAFFFAQWGIDGPALPSVDEDPVAAWVALDRAVQAAFDDPEIAGRERETRMGRSTFAETFDMIGTNDIFLHTWDLARAAGLDETLDSEEVHHLLVGMEPYDDALRQSGHYGPRVEVPHDASEQDRLIAFIGRRP